MFFTVKATVAAIIHPADGDTARILLTRRNCEPYKGRWCLPGGHIEKYEPVREAVIREVREETGLTFDAHFVGYFDEIIPDNEIHAVVMAFQGTGSGDLDAQANEVSEMRWMTLDEARSESLAFQHNLILDAYIAQKN